MSPVEHSFIHETLVMLLFRIYYPSPRKLFTTLPWTGCGVPGCTQPGSMVGAHAHYVRPSFLDSKKSTRVFPDSVNLHRIQLYEDNILLLNPGPCDNKNPLYRSAIFVV